jgi:tetratricopeptide (TPR) repeat protein
VTRTPHPPQSRLQTDPLAVSAIEDELRRRISRIEAQLGYDAPELIAPLLEQATFLRNVDRAGEAAAAAAQARALAEAIHGLDSPLAAQAQAVMGLCFFNLNRLDDATACLDRAISGLMRQPGSDPLLLSEALNALGVCLGAEGDHAAALSYFRQAIQLTESRPNPDRSRLSTWLANLSSAHVAMGEVAQGRAALDRAVAMREVIFGPDDPRTQKLRERLEKL